jgi:RNA polymerase sigma-70 factor (ECF subfamily)
LCKRDSALYRHIHMVAATDLQATVLVNDDAWERAVAETYHRRMRHLWEYGRRLGLDYGQAEDVAQEAFARLLGLPGERRPDRIEPWLFRTLRNLSVDEHRQAKRSKVRLIAGQTVATTTPDPSERLTLWDAVDRLPLRQRETVYLRYRVDLDYSTIASIIGTSESGARANVFRAMETLRDEVLKW